MLTFIPSFAFRSFLEIEDKVFVSKYCAFTAVDLYQYADVLKDNHINGRR